MKKLVIALVLVGVWIQGACGGSFEPLRQEYLRIMAEEPKAMMSVNIPQLDGLQADIVSLIGDVSISSEKDQKILSSLQINLKTLSNLLRNLKRRKEEIEGYAKQQLVVARQGKHDAEMQLAALQSNYDRALVQIAGDREDVAGAVLEQYKGASPQQKAKLEEKVAEANKMVVDGAELVLHQAREGDKKEEDIFKAASQIGQAQQMNEALIQGKSDDIEELQREVAHVEEQRDQAAEEAEGFSEQLDEAQIKVERLKKEVAAIEKRALLAKTEEERARLAEQAEREKEALKKAEAVAADYREKIQHRQGLIDELEQEKKRIEANIEGLRSDVENLKNRNEELQRLLEELSLESSKIATIRSTVANLYKQEVALAGIDATYVRLKALEGIEDIPEDVREEAHAMITRSRLDQGEKDRLLHELAEPLSEKQREELAELTKARRAVTLHQIRNAHTTIKSLLEDKERAIQEQVAPTQSTWQRWWSGGYDKANIKDEALRGDVSLLEREVELGKALRQVDYNATEAMQKFPHLFDKNQVMGMRPEAGGFALEGRQHLQIEAPAGEEVVVEQVAPGRMAQLALWGSRVKGWGAAAGRFAKDVFTPGAPETDILKIVANAKQEVLDREHREQEQDRQDQDEREAEWERMRQEQR
ncbi:hypothetical protein HOM50_04950 [bacterium]|jgi:hypothetical protein|nr:hypothetical protein [bacterium]MBT5015729.1 hypothetical protein [bacterium]